MAATYSGLVRRLILASSAPQGAAGMPCPGGLPVALRWRPLRRVDAVRAHLPCRATGLARSAAASSDPVQIIAGRRDGAVPPVNAEFLHKRLPHSKLDIIDAGYFTWEDGSDRYATLITTWWNGGYTTT